MLTLELKFPFFGFSYFQTLIATDCRFDFKWKYLLSYTFRGVMRDGQKQLKTEQQKCQRLALHGFR